MSNTSGGPIKNDAAANCTDSQQLDAQNVQKALMKNRLKHLSGPGKAMVLIAVLLAAVFSAFWIYKWTNASSGVEYLTMQVSRGNISDSIEATGTLEPVKKSEMGFKSDGKITALNVQPGDRVAAGQVLAEQDSANLRSALQQAESAVEQDEINIKSCTLAYEANLKVYNQQKALFEAGAASQSDLDTARDNMTKSEWDIATAKARLLNDQARVVEARSDLNGAILTAPFDGIIGAVNGQVGQINGINSSTSTLLTVISEDLQLNALVNEADIARIKIDQDVEFSSSAYPEKVFKGKVLRITPEAQSVSNVQYYPVLISCLDPDRQLLSGMSVTAKIIVAARNDVLKVSMMAVSYGQSQQNRSNSSSRDGTSKASGGRTSSSTTSGKPGTVVVLIDNQPVARQVVLGLSDGTNYEVIEGLNEGDKVIIGTNQAGSSPGPTGSARSNSSGQRQNQGAGPPAGGMMVRF